MTRGRASLRFGAVLLVALASTWVGPGRARAVGPGTFEQQWQVQGLLGGEAGSTAQSVLGDVVRLDFAGGRYHGSVAYGDVLGMTDGSQTQSQVSDIRLDLVGTSLEGGRSAGGTFSGTAVLTLRGATDLTAASSKEQLAMSSGDQRTYDVAGHWAARINGTTATGELLFQSVNTRAGGSGPIRPVAWFNRATGDFADPLGNGQTFTVSVTGANGRPAAKPGAAGGSANPAAIAPAPRLTPLDYIVRGLQGWRGLTPAPVSGAQALAAQALLDSAPSGATPLPADSIAVDLDVAGAYLDAKNRAAGLADGAGPVGDAVLEASRAAAASRANAPLGTSAGGSGDLGMALAGRLAAMLAPAAKAGVAGAQLLVSDAAAIGAGADAETVARLRTYLATAEALTAQRPLADSATPAFRAAKAVASAAVPQSGPLADAVLAAADSPKAPPRATVVTRFARETSLDVLASADATTSLPARALAHVAATGQPGAIAWDSSAGPRQVAPSKWLAYRRADGALFWLAGDAGPVALTDGSIRGWAWTSPRAALVDAERAGSVLALFDTR